MIRTFYMGWMHYDYYPVINCFQIENYVERSLSGDIFSTMHTYTIRYGTIKLDSWMDEDFDELLLIRTWLEDRLTEDDRSTY